MNACLVTIEKREGVASVIVLQEAFGVNSHIQNICHRFAAEGWIALAAELFHRSGNGLTFGYGDFQKLMPVFGKLNNDAIEMHLAATCDY